MTVLDVRPNLIQDKWNDVRFHSQKEHIALIDSLFVASCQVHPHFLQRGIWDRSGDSGEMIEGTLMFLFHFPSHDNRQKAHFLTLNPVTVGRSVSGELAVILCAAITPGEGDGRKWRARHTGVKDGGKKKQKTLRPDRFLSMKETR